MENDATSPYVSAFSSAVVDDASQEPTGGNVLDPSIDPSLDPSLDFHLDRLKDFVAGDVDEESADQGGPSNLEVGDGAVSAAADDAPVSPSAAPPPSSALSFQNLVHQSGEEEAVGSDPSGVVPNTPAYTPGPFNPYPDPTLPPPPVASGSGTSARAPPLPKPYKRSAEDLERAASEKKAKKVSSDKRAEQNRQAQKAFRERRDARIKELEAESIQLRAAQTREAQLIREVQLASNVIARLREENDALKMQLEQLRHGGGELQATVDEHEDEPLPDVGLEGAVEGEVDGPGSKRSRVYLLERESQKRRVVVMSRISVPTRPNRQRLMAQQQTQQQAQYYPVSCARYSTGPSHNIHQHGPVPAACW